MKTLFALLAFAAPAVAFATSLIPHPVYGSLTGTVKITPVVCVRAPCPPVVTVEGDNGISVKVTGELLRDVESLRGKEITVKGVIDGRGMNVTSVAPGRSHDFVTGSRCVAFVEHQIQNFQHGRQTCRPPQAVYSPVL